MFGRAGKAPSDWSSSTALCGLVTETRRRNKTSRRETLPVPPPETARPTCVFVVRIAFSLPVWFAHETSSWGAG